MTKYTTILSTLLLLLCASPATATVPRMKGRWFKLVSPGNRIRHLSISDVKTVNATTWSFTGKMNNDGSKVSTPVTGSFSKTTTGGFHISFKAGTLSFAGSMALNSGKATGSMMMAGSFHTNLVFARKVKKPEPKKAPNSGKLKPVKPLKAMPLKVKVKGKRRGPFPFYGTSGEFVD